MTAPGPPLVVTGMHRSGTSLVASLLADRGVAMGPELVAADSNNPRGYFEDLEIKELDRRILAAACRDDDGGHPDWGWTEGDSLEPLRFAPFRDEARALLAERRRTEPWGFKDPRASLLLDFWLRAAPDARFLLLYRFPWDVADSMQRLGAEVFLRRPDYAYRIWRYYNRHLLDFYRRHRERCLLVSTNELLERPERLFELLAGRLDLELEAGELDALLAPGRFQVTDGSHPLIGLLALTRPETVELLAELDQAADLSSAGRWEVPPANRAFAPAGELAEVDVSVVIPCRDMGELLLEAVASVEHAAPPNTELLIVDDGSAEARTREILATLEGAGYRILSQENRGLPVARNRGIAASRGRYVLPLDADNRIRPAFIQTAMRVLDSHPDVGVVYGDWYEFGLRAGRKSVPPFDLDTLLWGNFIDACAVFRHQVWLDTGGYDTVMSSWADWEFWVAAAERGWRFYRLPVITFDYRVRPGSLVSQMERREMRQTLRRHVLEKHRSLYEERLAGIIEALGRQLRDQQTALEILRGAPGKEHPDVPVGRLEAEFEQQRKALARLAGEHDMARELLAARDREIARLHAEMLELHRAVAERDELLDQMRSSRGWRLLTRLREARDRALPDGSRRRLAWDRLRGLLGRG